jgi:hypothetical protein
VVPDLFQKIAQVREPSAGASRSQVDRRRREASRAHPALAHVPADRREVAAVQLGKPAPGGAGRVALLSMPKIAGYLLVMTFAAVPVYMRLRQGGTSATTSIELLVATLLVVIPLCLIAGLRARVDRRAGHIDLTRPPGKRKVPRRLR